MPYIDDGYIAYCVAKTDPAKAAADWRDGNRSWRQLIACAIHDAEARRILMRHFRLWRHEHRKRFEQPRRPPQPPRRSSSRSRSPRPQPRTTLLRAAAGRGSPAEPDPDPTSYLPLPLFDGGTVLPASIVAPILEPLKRTRAWALLSMHDRAQVIWHLRSGSAARRIDDVLAQSAQSRGEHLSGTLWLWGDELPANGLMVRDRRSGLWRVLQFDPDSTAHESWETRGRA
jgi:hypothetical protein